MKILSKILLASIFLCGPAASLANGPGWITTAKVSKIVVAGNGGINFRLTPDLGGCTSQSGYGPLYASVYPNHPGLDKIYSTLLAAYMADKVVAVYLSDSTCRVAEVELGGR